MKQDGHTRWHGRKSHPPKNSEHPLVGGNWAWALRFPFHLFIWGWEESWSRIHITEAAPQVRRPHSPVTGVPGPAVGSCAFLSHCAELPSDEGSTWTCPVSHKSQLPHVDSSTLEGGYSHLKCALSAKPTPALEDLMCISQQCLHWLHAEMIVFWTCWVK